MAQEALNNANIDSLIDQSVAGRMSQHMRMDLQMLQAGSFRRLQRQIEDDSRKTTPYVVSENITRCNLTPGQKAAVADKVANLPNGVRSDRPGQAVGIPLATR